MSRHYNRFFLSGGNDRKVLFCSIIMMLELALVIVLGILSANLLLSFMGSRDYIPQSLAMISPLSSATAQKQQLQSRYDNLLSYDPFFGAKAALASLPHTDAPESNLNISIFGLRYQPSGNSSVIVKIQGQNQVRAIAGDSLSTNVRLVGIYEDRIEITRNGARESVYFHGESKRRHNSYSADKSSEKFSKKADQRLISTLLKSLDLTILRSGRKVDGFVIGDGANKIFLTSLELEGGDLLVSVNGESLNSYEKLEELPDEINGATHLEINLVRRGVAKEHIVPLAGLIGK